MVVQSYNCEGDPWDLQLDSAGYLLAFIQTWFNTKRLFCVRDTCHESLIVGPKGQIVLEDLFTACIGQVAI